MSNPTTNLKQAYDLVTADLFSRLVKAKPNETIKIGTLGALGSLKKSESQMTSHMKKTFGNTYVFYRVKFTPASKLKQALNQALEAKYG